jgi:hypothetical protein
MPLPLPTPIELFMSSENTHDLEALADCFAAHATVRDEGQTMQGLNATHLRPGRGAPPHRARPLASYI